MKRTLLTIIIISALAIGIAPPVHAKGEQFTNGLQLFNSGQWALAASVLVTAAMQNPADAAVRLTTGVALANVKRYAEAVEQFKAVAKMSPNDVLPQLLLDGTYSEMGNAQLSRQARARATEILSSGRAFNKRSGPNSVLTKSLKLYPQNAIAHCLLGDMYQIQGNMPLAREQYVIASGLVPKWAKPLFNLGMADLDSDPKSSEAYFRRAKSLSPSNLRVDLWLGDAYLRQGQQAKAIETYNSAATDKDLAAEAQTRIGNAQMLAGNYLEAEREFKAAAKQAPHDPRPIAGHAQALQNMGKLDEAESNYRQAASVMAENNSPAQSQAVVQNQITIVQTEQGKLPIVWADVDRKYQLQPTLETAVILAELHQKAGISKPALEQREEYLKRKPHDKSSLLYLFAAYKLTGDNYAAASMAQRLIDDDPKNSQTYYFELAQGQERMGDKKAAMESYRRAVEGRNSEISKKAQERVDSLSASD